MNTETESFEEILRQARNGDRAAVARLVRCYETEIRIVARIKLGGPLRPYLDSLDLVQSVHRSVMIGLRSNQFDISTPDRLVALAMTIVRRKIARQWRKVRRQRRLGEADGSPANAELPYVFAALHDRDIGPDEQAALVDQLQVLFERLDETERQLIQLRLDGCSTAEAARSLALDPDVLRVKLARLRRRVKELGVLADWL